MKRYTFELYHNGYRSEHDAIVDGQDERTARRLFNTSYSGKGDTLGEVLDTEEYIYCNYCRCLMHSSHFPCGS